MEQFFDKHPELKELIINNESKRYTQLDAEGNLIEQWELNESGEWIDVTERELLKIEIAKATEELEKFKEAISNAVK